MCVAAVAWDCHPDLLLVAIANRDEFHERPTAPLDRWRDTPDIIAGRDLRGGGTWLGVSEEGQFALLTNFRDPAGFVADRPSRGAVVADLLAGHEPTQMAAMNPLNAFHAAPGRARFLTNYPEAREDTLAGGIHGLSNGPFSQPWPKTARLSGDLADWLKRDAADIEPLFSALRAESPRPADPAPVHAPEPDYAPVFIADPRYGTRCSTVVIIGRDGSGLIAERRFDALSQPAGTRRIAFRWPA